MISALKGGFYTHIGREPEATIEARNCANEISGTFRPTPPRKRALGWCRWMPEPSRRQLTDKSIAGA